MISSTKKIQGLQFLWLHSKPCILPQGCNYIHEGPCLLQFLKRLADVCKIGLKYYVFFHILPLALRLKKRKTNKERQQAIFRTIYQYVKSVLFMGFLVALTKGSLCINNHFGGTLDGVFLFRSSWLSGLSILWEQKGRQRQIGYFILAKAIRSMYEILKRTNKFSFSNQSTITHILLMAFLSYIYHHEPEILKYRETIQLIWEKD